MESTCGKFVKMVRPVYQISPHCSQLTQSLWHVAHLLPRPQLSSQCTKTLSCFWSVCLSSQVIVSLRCCMSEHFHCNCCIYVCVCSSCYEERVSHCSCFPARANTQTHTYVQRHTQTKKKCSLPDCVTSHKFHVPPPLLPYMYILSSTDIKITKAANWQQAID